MADFSLTATPGRALPLAISGRGARIVDEDGRSVIDACGGAMVMGLGHAHPRLVEVVQRQVAELSFTYRFSFRNRPMLELAELLREIAPFPKAWSFFNSSGSEAVESAIHLAILYWQLAGKPQKTDFISRWPSYHGSTLGAMALSGSGRRSAFEAVLAKHPIAPTAGADIRARRSPEAEAEWAARELEDAIVRRGPEHVAAVFLEPITGSQGAAIPPPADYLRRVRELCDRYELLLVFDETITAMGRTGDWFAACHWPDALPDVITYAKGVTSGIVPFSGMLVRAEIAEVFEQSPDGFPWGHTFSGYPLGCAVAAEVIRVIRDEQLLEAARTKGAWLRGRLDELAARHAAIGQVRGRGLLQGLELVTDRETLTPLSGGSAKLTAACRERGLMIYPCPTTLGATTLEAVLLAPPLVTPDSELAEIVEILDDALSSIKSS